MTEMFAKLSEDDKRMMEHWIDSYAINSCDCSRSAGIDELLRCWDKNKSQYLYGMFGGNFILSKRVEFKKDADELTTDMGNAICWNGDGCDPAAHKFFCDLRVAVKDYVNGENSPIAKFSDRYAFDYLFDQHCLATNRFPVEDITLPLPDGKIMKIQKGQKITKALARLADVFHIEGYEDFRLAHSQVLNQKKLTGTMSLSIHPMDYMTMSDNDCGWSSCMSWIEEGCYRQGTVEMMNSPMVVVAYLASDEEMCVPGGYTWNSKKWRQLFIVNRDVISNVKAYPYRNDDLTFCALDWLKELAEKAGLGTYTQNHYKWQTNHECQITEWNQTMRLEFYTDYMYNDFSSSRDDQYCMVSQTMDFEHYASYNYSGESMCMCCGNINADYDGREGRLCCEDCEPCYYCEDCGDFHDRDELYELDGCLYCEYCYGEHAATDMFSGDEHDRDNMFAVDLLTNDAKHRITCLELYGYASDEDDLVTQLKDLLMEGTHVYKYNRARWCGTTYGIRYCDLLRTEDNRDVLGIFDNYDYFHNWKEADESYVEWNDNGYISDELGYEVME